MPTGLAPSDGLMPLPLIEYLLCRLVGLSRSSGGRKNISPGRHKRFHSKEDHYLSQELAGLQIVALKEEGNYIYIVYVCVLTIEPQDT